ncbi:MAG: DUF1549 domain-containing protein, partial [Vicinamibacterales bacterium]
MSNTCFIAVAIMVPALAQTARQVTVADCTLESNREEFLTRQARARRNLYETTMRVGRSAGRGGGETVYAAEIPIRNFVDQAIFGKLVASKVPSAKLSGDEEFLRRLHLDLTGTIPSPEEVREFLASDSPSKRDDVIDRLLYTPAFRDRWTMWLMDLLQNVAFPANFDRQYRARNAFQDWGVRVIDAQKSLRDVAIEAITATGNTFDSDSAGTNWPINGKTPMGPIQDTYDTMLNKNATTFLGLSHYDCLLCHNGRGHLELVSLWGSTATRLEAQQMAAFFARLNMPQRANQDPSAFYYRSFDVSDRLTGNYDLNTNFGNRPDRTPYSANRFLTPVY